MLASVSLFLLVCAGVGTLALFLIALSVRRQAKESPRQPQKPLPPISILKPLCGIDEDLEQSLELFAALDYPEYEVVLGVRDESDTAYPLARKAAQRWPGKFRVVTQVGEPGFNPKVNQLITLTEAARHELFVVSDSNARLDPSFLREIAAHFEDEDVGCVGNPVAGHGERSLGALLDNFHLSSAIGPGQVSAKRVTDKDIIVGKSMALRKSDLATLGGWAAFKDYLAEDYVLAMAVRHQLKKRNVVAHLPVYNVSTQRPLGDFVRRYVRWSIIHRTAITLPTYLGQSLLNPAPLAWLAVLIHPARWTLELALAVTFAKCTIDVWSASMLRGKWFGLYAFLITPFKDAIIFMAWVNGLYADTVMWRGNRLRVLHGSRLVPADEVGEVETAGL